MFILWMNIDILSDNRFKGILKVASISTFYNFNHKNYQSTKRMLLLIFLVSSIAASIQHCQYSKIDSSNITRCTICFSGFSLSLDYTQCNQCSTVSPHCLRCNSINQSQLQCQSCDYGYIVHLNTCVPIFQCDDQNCIVCLNPSQCSYCQQGYYLNATTKACLSCPFKDMYDTYNQECACDFGYYLMPNTTEGGYGCRKCVNPCQECLNSASNCSQCIYGYFMKEMGTCQPCLTPNCIICQNEYTCLNCTLGYKLSSRGECEIQLQMMNIQNYINLPEVYYFCQEGCFYCYRYDFCLTCLEGYSRDLNTDTCRRCSSGCRTCQAIQSMQCYSCYPGFRLYQNTCFACIDQYCLNCSTAEDKCTQCQLGYTQVNNTCQPCAANCISCEKEGPLKCDSNSCVGGFTRVNIDQCAVCALGCYSCSPVDISTCLTCPLGSFQIQGGQCQICPSGCTECLSESVCTGCQLNYRLVKEKCYENCDYPCLECSLFNKYICSACFKGYSLSENLTCVPDVTCSQTQNCTICPLAYYLTFTRTCNTCQLQPHCIKCQTEAQKCVICEKGYFVLQNTCHQCDQNCLICQLYDRCFSCRDGYYLSQNDSQQVYGSCLLCSQECLTCTHEPNQCTSCSLDKELIGFQCVTSQNVIFQLTLQHATISEANSQSIAFIKEIVGFTRYVAQVLGSPYEQNPSMLYVKDISTGSVIVTYMASTEKMDPRVVLEVISRRMKDIKVYGQFTIIGSQIIANGFQSDKVVESSPTLLYVSFVPAPFFLALIAVSVCQLSKKQQIEATEVQKKTQPRQIKLQPLDSQKNLRSDLNGAITL